MLLGSPKHNVTMIMISQFECNTFIPYMAIYIKILFHEEYISYIIQLNISLASMVNHIKFTSISVTPEEPRIRHLRILVIAYFKTACEGIIGM